MRRFVTWFGLVAVLGLMLGTGQAQAQQFLLTGGNDALTPLNPGPFASVTLSQIPQDGVLFDVHALNITRTGLTTSTPASISDVGVNGLPTGTTVSSPGFTGTVVMGTPAPALTTNANFDGFGNFASGVTLGPNTNRTTDITFVVSGATLSQLLAAPLTFAIHYYSNFDIASTQLTGFADVTTRVPEPGPLLGGGLVTMMGLGYAWRRRKRPPA
jgi:hypothetical protein